MDLKEVIALELEAARGRSLDLLSPLSEEDQIKQHSPLMSPLVWDLTHVGNFEEIWLLRNVARRKPLVSAEFDAIYDPGVNPRRVRGGLPLPGPVESRSYIADVRGQALDVLERIDLDPAQRLFKDGYVYGMIVQHEHQHDETMLATLQLKEGDPYPLATPAPPARAALQSSEVLIPGGSFTMGTDTDAWAYDNERPAHTVQLAPYFIDTTPVTNAAYLEFIDAGGYHDRQLWSDAGWEWRQQAELEHPQFWRREGQSSWSVLRFGARISLPLPEPVQHVCWYEADAYAHWAGKRLPTEAEWEKAASWEPSSRKRRFPWGDEPIDDARANVGQRHFGPGAVGAYPQGVSPWGCHQMLGDVWEWCSSDFRPYPGFSSFPYPEYSEIFFGDEYKVLRGGSWATSPHVARNTFRNWDFPIRRQIFSGFRCVRDA